MNNLTDKLEAFSKVLKSLNNGDNQVSINLTSISKLNRLKRKLEGIKFIQSWDKKRREGIQNIDALHSKTREFAKNAHQPFFDNEKNSFLESLASSFKSIMKTLNRINMVNIASANSNLNSITELKTVEIYINALFQNKSRIYYANLGKSQASDCSDDGDLDFTDCNIPHEVELEIRKMIDEGRSSMSIEQTSSFNDIFELPEGAQKYLLLDLFDTSEDQKYFALIHVETISFFVRLAKLDRTYREVENFFSKALVELCDLIFEKARRESIAKISEFNYKFVCFVVENIPKLTIIILNDEFMAKGEILKLIDLRNQHNEHLLRHKDRIYTEDDKSTLIFHRFKLGVILPFIEFVDLRPFYRSIDRVLLDYSNKINNFTITKLSSLQFGDIQNRVAFEFVSSGNFIYQEGAIIPEVKEILSSYLNFENLDKQLSFESIFEGCEMLKTRLKELRESTNQNCIDFQLNNQIHCYLRTKIDPLGKEIGFLIILRLKQEDNTPKNRLKEDMDKYEIVEIARESNLKDAIQKISDHLMKKYKLKRGEFLNLISQKEKYVEQLEEQNQFKNTILEEYLLSHKLRSNKKSILFVNQAKLKDLNRLQTVYNASTANGENKEEREGTLQKQASEKSESLSKSIYGRQSKKESEFETGSMYYTDQDLDEISLFEFDIMKYKDDSQKRKNFIYAMFDNCDILSHYNVNLEKFSAYCDEAEKLYDKNKNPYHNYEHGITVLQINYYFLKETICHQYFKTKMSIAALLFGSYVHDMYHTGRNNQFMIRNMTSMARRYNDIHVLENHHCATAFKVLLTKGTDFFEFMPRSDFILFRKYVIHGILNTDMSEHTNMVNKIDIKINKEKDFLPDEEDQPENFLYLFGLLIHTADLYAPTRNFKTSRIWAKRINDEFLEQLNDEIKANLQPTAFFLELHEFKKQAKSLHVFINQIVFPLWKLVDKVVEGALKDKLKQIKENAKKWEKIANDEEVDLDDQTLFTIGSDDELDEEDEEEDEENAKE